MKTVWKHIVIPFPEMSGEGKCAQRGNRFLVASVWGLEGAETVDEVSFGDDGNVHVLKLECADD